MIRWYSPLCINCSRARLSSRSNVVSGLRIAIATLLPSSGAETAGPWREGRVDEARAAPTTPQSRPSTNHRFSGLDYKDGKIHKNYIRWVRLLDRDIVRDLKDNQNERTARQLSESALVKPL